MDLAKPRRFLDDFCPNVVTRGMNYDWLYRLDLCTARALAADESTIPELLYRLAFHTDEEVRVNIAANFSSPPGSFTQLREDDSLAVLMALAQNTRCTPHVLRHLACLEAPAAKTIASYNALRLKIIENTNADSETIWLLSRNHGIKALDFERSLELRHQKMNAKAELRAKVFPE